MAKFLGLLMVFGCGALLGWGKALGMSRRAGELEKWREFLKEFRIHLEATRSSPREIVRTLGKQNAFTDSPGIQALRSAFEMDSSFSRSSPEGGYEMAKELFRKPIDYTAIFASTDSNALGIMRAADEMGIQIPEQLSLMGFDNISASALSRIDLTTVEQSKREMAT